MRIGLDILSAGRVTDVGARRIAPDEGEKISMEHVATVNTTKDVSKDTLGHQIVLSVGYVPV